MITLISAFSTLFALVGGMSAVSLGDTPRDERTVSEYLIPVVTFTIAIAGWMTCFYWEYYL